jgi:putative toxin-antitoxin system antitoxin component (TIGR02293 family)
MAKPRSPLTKNDVERYRRFSTGESRTAHAYLAFLGLSGQETFGLVRKLETGLPFSAFERLRRTLGVTAGEFASVIGIPERTLARRRNLGRLTPGESDRLVRVSRVFARTIDLYDGDATRARGWLTSALIALEGRRPFDLLATEVGARDVETILGRLEHGVFS